MPKQIENSPTKQQELRFEALALERKTELLDYAEQEYIANGFDGASLNKILSNVGMSKGQAYYYINDKADLYFRVCERAFYELTEKIGGWSIDTESKDGFWPSIDKLFDAVTIACLSDTRISALGRTVYTSAAAYEALTKPLKQIQSYTSEIVVRGQRLSAIRTDLPIDLISTILFSHLVALDRWFALNLSKHSPEKMLEYNEICRKIFHDLASSSLK